MCAKVLPFVFMVMNEYGAVITIALVRCCAAVLGGCSPPYFLPEYGGLAAWLVSVTAQYGALPACCDCWLLTKVGLISCLFGPKISVCQGASPLDIRIK